MSKNTEKQCKLCKKMKKNDEMVTPWVCKECKCESENGSMCARCLKDAFITYSDVAYSGDICGPCVDDIKKLNECGANKVKGDKYFNRFVNINLIDNWLIYCFNCMKIVRKEHYFKLNGTKEGRGCISCIQIGMETGLRYCLACKEWKRNVDMYQGTGLCQEHQIKLNKFNTH